MPTETNGPGSQTLKKTRKTPFNIETQVQERQFRSVFLSTAEAATILGLSVATMRKYCQDGCFTNTFIFGSEWLVSMYDVQWWKQNRKGRLGRPRTGE